MCGNCCIIGKKSVAKALLTTHESWSWLSIWKCWRVCHQISFEGKFLQLKVERPVSAVWWRGSQMRYEPEHTPVSLHLVYWRYQKMSHQKLHCLSYHHEKMWWYWGGLMGSLFSGGFWKAHLYLPGFYQVKGEVNDEDLDVQSLSLFPTVFLKFSDGEYHCWLFCTQTTLWLWIISLLKHMDML